MARELAGTHVQRDPRPPRLRCHRLLAVAQRERVLQGQVAQQSRLATAGLSEDQHAVGIGHRLQHRHRIMLTLACWAIGGVEAIVLSLVLLA